MLLLTVLLTIASTCVQGQSSDSRSNNRAKEFMVLQKAEDDAESKKDIAALDRLLSDDFVFTAPTGAITDKKQFLEGVRNDAPEEGQTISYDDATARVYGRTAVVRYLLIVKGRDKNGKDYANRYRNTVVWVKQQGHWRMVAIHVSRLRP